MKIKSAGITDIGKRRQKNEDSFLVNDTLSLYLVADGMGGHAGGEFASKIAVSTIEEVIASKNETSALKWTYFTPNIIDNPLEQLIMAVNVAGVRIYKFAKENPKLKGMGTTITACMIHDTKAYIAHVGDSRLYHITKETIRQVTGDHSLVSEQIRQGKLTPEEAKNHRLRNVITRSLGISHISEIDTFTIDLKPDDVLVLCSDGAYNGLSTEEFHRIFIEHDIEFGVERLITTAITQDGDDNATCVAIKIL